MHFKILKAPNLFHCNSFVSKSLRKRNKTQIHMACLMNFLYLNSENKIKVLRGRKG